MNYDLFVIGGGYAGIAAAYEAAARGKTVLLAESRTYLGIETTASRKLWMSSSAYEAIRAEFGIEEHFATYSDASGEHIVIPDRLKTALEDRLLAQGATLVYAAKVIRWAREGSGYDVTLCGKFGMNHIHANRIIDATPTAVAARCARTCEERYLDRDIAGTCVLEWTGIDTNRLDASVGRYHLDSGVRGHGFVELAVSVSPSESANWRSDTGIKARLAAMERARALKRDHPAFMKAKLAGTGHELVYSPTARIKSDSLREDEPAYVIGDAKIGANQLRDSHGIWYAGGTIDIDNERSAALSARIEDLLQLGRLVGGLAVVESGCPMGLTGVTCELPREIVHVDVLVVGGGTSGATAGIVSARQGARTFVSEMNEGLGGTGTIGGVDSYWFGRRCGFNRMISDWVREEQAWLGEKWTGVTEDRWNIEGKMLALLKGVSNSGARVEFGSVVFDVLKTGNRITGACLAASDRIIEVHAAVTIDATGDGDVAVMAGAAYVYGSARDAQTMWYSMAPVVRPGVTRNNFTSTVDVGDAEDYTRAILSARRRYPGYDHGVYIAPRESRHIEGEVCLTLTDQLKQREWPDVVNLCFSNNDMKGNSTSDWVRIGLISPHLEIEIPYRALLPATIDGLLVAGKAISATHDALPAIRMQADLENIGGVCGVAAALCASRELMPRHLPIAELQRLLVDLDVLPAALLNRQLGKDTAHSATEEQLREWVDRLDEQEQLHEYSNMGFLDVHKGAIPFVEICTAGERVIPFLLEKVGAPEDRGRLNAARALAWYGRKEATPVLLSVIEPYLQLPELPPRSSRILHVNAPPDQGAMPDLAYLLYTLALARDPRAIPVLERAQRLLQPTREKFTDRKHGLFYYVDSLCYIAERLGDPACIPALRRLSLEPMFRNNVMHRVMEIDFFGERQAFLEIVIGRALARCGSRDGYETLIRYLLDRRKLLARHAHQELCGMTGEQIAASAPEWSAWLSAQGELPPRPWLEAPGST